MQRKYVLSWYRSTSHTLRDSVTRYDIHERLSKNSFRHVVTVWNDAKLAKRILRDLNRNSAPIYRSAVTGRIVTAAYAKRHPKTTIRERNR